MGLRNKFIFFSFRLGVLLFFLMFVFLFVAGFFVDQKLVAAGAIILFFSSIFFIGLSFLPPKISKEHFGAWLMFFSFMMISISGGIAFISTFVFSAQLNSPLVSTGAIFFMLGIVLLIFSALIPTRTYRGMRDTKEIETAFAQIAKELSLTVNNESTAEKLLLKVEGNIDFGKITLIVENEFPVRKPKISMGQESKKLATASSKIIITPLNQLPDIKIVSLREALEFSGFEGNFKLGTASALEKMIIEKNLNYFDFRLYSAGNSIFLEVNVAIEEKELWGDYIKLIEFIVSEREMV